MARLNVVGFDPSLRNWGIACGVFNTDTLELRMTHIERVAPVQTKEKGIRVNSKDLHRSEQLAKRAFEIGKQAHALFVEVPVGSKSAAAMKSYGVCVGILASLRGTGIPLLEVSPEQVKMIATRTATATKKQMIDWASTLYPTLPWPTYTRNGTALITQDAAEHMADAIGAIHAGIATPEFQRMLPLLRAA